MRPIHSRAETESRLTDALVRLSSARREKLSKEDFDVYADGLREFPIDVVQRVCLELGRTAPADFQPRFPPLYLIRERCIEDVERSRKRRQLLKEPPPEPLAPEKWAEIQRMFAEVIGRKSWR